MSGYAPGVTNGGVLLNGPSADGSANQYLKTDGAGNLSFGTVDLSGYQPLDADLTALAALGYTSGSFLIKKTAANTYSLIALTAAGEALLDDADAAAQRTTMGALGGSLGSTDNRLLRSDGTGGATAQGSAVTVDDSGNVSGVVTLSATTGIISSGYVLTFGAGAALNYNGASIKLPGSAAIVWGATLDAAWRTRLYESAAGTLTVDNGSGGNATLAVTGNLTASGTGTFGAGLTNTAALTVADFQFADGGTINVQSRRLFIRPATWGVGTRLCLYGVDGSGSQFVHNSIEFANNGGGAQWTSIQKYGEFACGYDTNHDMVWSLAETIAAGWGSAGNFREVMRLSKAGSLTVIGSLTTNGTFYAANGYVTTPSYSFANDTNTGWYSYSADVMAAAAGGKIAAQVDYNGSSNYCEAGTNLRAYNVHAASKMYLGGSSVYAETSNGQFIIRPELRVYNAVGNGFGPVYASDVNPSGTVNVAANQAIVFAADGYIKQGSVNIFATGSDTTYWGTKGSSGPHSFRVGDAVSGTEVMKLSANGLTIPPSTFAALPSASANTGAILRVTDRGQKLVHSDGTDWRFVHDNTIAS